jgi:hypothetical protein
VGATGKREREILLKYEDFEAFLGRCISDLVSVGHMANFIKLNPEELLRYVKAYS